MKEVENAPQIHVWVCINRRDQSVGSSKPSCGYLGGEEVWESLKSECRRLQDELSCRIRVSKTMCQGACHSGGVTVTLSPSGGKWQAVTLKEVPSITEKVRILVDNRQTKSF